MDYDPSIAVAVDFDGTVTKGSWFAVHDEPDWHAIRWLKRISALNGVVLVLWTTREGEMLEEAKRLAFDWGVPFEHFNEYPLRPDPDTGNGRKPNVDVYIDDKANDGRIRWFRTYLRIRKLVMSRGVIR